MLETGLPKVRIETPAVRKEAVAVLDTPAEPQWTCTKLIGSLGSRTTDSPEASAQSPLAATSGFTGPPEVRKALFLLDDSELATESCPKQSTPAYNENVDHCSTTIQAAHAPSFSVSARAEEETPELQTSGVGGFNRRSSDVPMEIDEPMTQLQTLQANSKSSENESEKASAMSTLTAVSLLHAKAGEHAKAEASCGDIEDLQTADELRVSPVHNSNSSHLAPCSTCCLCVSPFQMSDLSLGIASQGGGQEDLSIDTSHGISLALLKQTTFLVLCLQDCGSNMWLNTSESPQTCL